MGSGGCARPAAGASCCAIVLPQALRVIIPPMTSQYLNLTKNSSLAVAVGYQDIVSIANTTLNQTGQAIEAIALIMAVFLTISLSHQPVHELVQCAYRAGGALSHGLATTWAAHSAAGRSCAFNRGRDGRRRHRRERPPRASMAPGPGSSSTFGSWWSTALISRSAT